MFTLFFAISRGVRSISPRGARRGRGAPLSPRNGKILRVLFRKRSICEVKAYDSPELVSRLYPVCTILIWSGVMRSISSGWLSCATHVVACTPCEHGLLICLNHTNVRALIPISPPECSPWISLFRAAVRALFPISAPRSEISTYLSGIFLLCSAVQLTLSRQQQTIR